MKHWTAVERREIASLLRRKLTAGQIALRYEGRSRSAVISFVRRMPELAEIGFLHDKNYSRSALDKRRES